MAPVFKHRPEEHAKFLIIGEAGENPWSAGSASLRLYYWFGVSGYEGLKSLAHLTNVYRNKGSVAQFPGHQRHVRSLIDSVKHVVLVGKVAQLKYGPHTSNKVVWCTDRQMGLPHPSGLNRQLNEIPDETIARYIDNTLRMWGYR